LQARRFCRDWPTPTLLRHVGSTFVRRSLFRTRRHYLFSELLSERIAAPDLSLRLIDEQATLLMSVLHVDYKRRDIAADHGADCLSTFNEFKCQGEQG